MEVLTLPIRKTSTWLILLLLAPMLPRSFGWIAWVCRSSGSSWNRTGRSFNAGSSTPISGADDAVRWAARGTPPPGDWRTSRWGGAQRCCWSRSAGTAAAGAGTCGGKTPARPRSRGPGYPEACCGGRWKRIVCQHLTVARVFEGLGVSWNTANDAVLAEGRRVLIADPHRFDGVKVIGVDEYVWRHTRRGNKYVTVIIDLTPVRDRRGPARLLDMVEGRSKQVFKTWLSER